MKIIKGNLILKEDTTFNEDLKVEGNIFCEGGRFDLKVEGNINCCNINCGNINCCNINCGNINCLNIDCGNINCLNIDCGNIDCLNIDCLNIDCWNINFNAFAIAYSSFRCKSANARRKHFVFTRCFKRSFATFSG